MDEFRKPDRGREIKETGRQRESFEIKNATGENICTVAIDFFDRANTSGERLATKITLVDPRNGQSINLSELVSVPDVTIFLGDKQWPDASHFDIRKREVHSSLPKNAFDFATLLHELGHAEQMLEEKWQDLGAFARMGTAVLSPDDFLKIFTYLKIASQDYETLGILKPEIVHEALGLLAEYREAIGALKAAEQENDEVVREASRLEKMFFFDRFVVLPEDIGRWSKKYAQSRSDSEKDAVVAEMRAAGVLVDQTEFFPEVEDPEAVDLASRRQLVMDQISKLATGKDLEIFVDFPEDDSGLALAQVILDSGDSEHSLSLPIVFEADDGDVRDYRDKLNGLLSRSGTLHASIDDLNSKIAKLKNDKVQKWFEANKADLKEETRRPRRLEERDATRRALLWLRRLKQEFDIDLLQDVVMELNFDDDETVCLGVTDVAAELKKALATYNATSKQMKRGKLKPELPERKQKAA